MAGIFLQQAKIFNRAPIALSVFFDGERRDIPVGHSTLPSVTTYMAKNQNPIMGTGEPNNPHVSGTKYLIQVEDEQDPDYGVALTKSEWETHLNKPCRMDEEAAFAEKYSGDPKAKLVIRGAGKKSTAANRYEAGAPVHGTADFTHRDA